MSKTKRVYLQVDNGVYLKGAPVQSKELILDENFAVISPDALPEDFVSGSLSLPLQTDDGKEAPANSYALRKFNVSAINAIRKKYDLKGEVDISVKTSKKPGAEVKRYLTYTAYKNAKA